jgi:hypothetical protein
MRADLRDMIISKSLIFLFIVGLIFMLMGSDHYQNSPMFLFATSSSVFQHVREIIAGTLFLQLITRPPRHMVFRALTGLISLITATWTIYETVNAHMLPLDSLLFFGAAVVIGTVALEGRDIINELKRNDHFVSDESIFVIKHGHIKTVK